MEGYCKLCEVMTEYMTIMNDRKTRVNAQSGVLQRLEQVRDFFLKWKSDVEKLGIGAMQQGYFLTDEAYEDIMSSILGFIGCVRHYYTTEDKWTIARRWSQDKVENLFSSYKENTSKLEVMSVRTRSGQMSCTRAHRPHKDNAARTSYSHEHEETMDSDGDEKPAGTFVLPYVALREAKERRKRKAAQQEFVWGAGTDYSLKIRRLACYAHHAVLLPSMDESVVRSDSPALFIMLSNVATEKSLTFMPSYHCNMNTNTGHQAPPLCLPNSPSSSVWKAKRTVP
jgi:hypothetical protein